MENLPNVAIVEGEFGHKPVFEALDLIDYKKALAGFDKVLIKINFIVSKLMDSSATADPLVIEAIILKLKDLKIKEIYVAESESALTNANELFEATRLKEMCTRNGVECIDLSDAKKKVKLTIPNPEKLKTVTVPRLVTESAIISAGTRATLGMKNLFGLIMDKAKTKYYAKGIENVAVDINTVIKPKLTVISGFFGLEGKVDSGKSIKNDLIVAGDDVVATDAVASRVMGYDPSNIKYLCKASEKGIGNINARILGQQIDAAAKNLKKQKLKILVLNGLLRQVDEKLFAKF